MAKRKKTIIARAPEDIQPTGSAPLDPEYDPKQPIPKKTKTQIAKKAKEDEDDLNEEIDENFRAAQDAAAEWIEEAKEDIDFKAGNQWTEDDKAALRLAKRPCLTFNKIRPIVKLLTGHFIQNSERIECAPEGGEDEQFSQISDKILSHIDEQANLTFNLGYQFAGGETTGLSWIELYLDYQTDPIFGVLKSIYHGKPGTIYLDPRGSSYDPNDDRQYLFKLVRKTKSQLKELYPNKAKDIDEITVDSENPDFVSGKEGDANNYGQAVGRSKLGVNKTSAETSLNVDGKSYHVKEYWRFKLMERWYVYFMDSGDMPMFDTEAEADAETATRRQKYVAEGGDPTKWAPVKKKRQRKEMHVAIRCGGKLLDNDKSPWEPHYSGFPFFPFIADWTPEAEDEVLRVQGIVRSLKDPQREKNKARSQMLHIINTSANSGWIIDEDAMDEKKKEELRKFGSAAGVVIQKKSGKEVRRIEATPPPIASQVREKAASDDFKEVSGINSDLLAVDSSSNPSGKAIALRIRQAITILEPDFRNFRYTKKLIGTAMMKMVPTMFDVPKLKKILGKQFLDENQLDDIKLTAYLIQIEDLRYNVRIAEHGDTKTMREETFEDLSNMMQNGMPLPPDLMIEFMNIPNKTEVVGRIKEYQQQQAQQAMAMEAAKRGGQPGA
jgi:hypothetical protein